MSTTSTSLHGLVRRGILEHEVGQPFEVRERRRERLAHVVGRAHPHELHVGVHRQPPDELGAAKPEPPSTAAW